MIRPLVTLKNLASVWRWLDDGERTPSGPARLIDALIEDEMLSSGDPSGRSGLGSAPLDPGEFELAARAARIWGTGRHAGGLGRGRLPSTVPP